MKIVKSEPYESFLQILQVWDSHYYYPSRHSTNRTADDGHYATRFINGRYIGNSRAIKNRRLHLLKKKGKFLTQ